MAGFLRSGALDFTFIVCASTLVSEIRLARPPTYMPALISPSLAFSPSNVSLASSTKINTRSGLPLAPGNVSALFSESTDLIFPRNGLMPEDGTKLFLMNQYGVKTGDNAGSRRPCQALASFCAPVVKINYCFSFARTRSYSGLTHLLPQRFRVARRPALLSVC